MELCLGITEPVLCFLLCSASVALLFPPLQPTAPSQTESSLKTVLPCIDTGSSCSWSLAAPMMNRQAGCRAPIVHAACSGRLLPKLAGSLDWYLEGCVRRHHCYWPHWNSVGLKGPPAQRSQAETVACLGHEHPDSSQPLGPATGPTQHPNEQDGQ